MVGHMAQQRMTDPAFPAARNNAVSIISAWQNAQRICEHDGGSEAKAPAAILPTKKEDEDGENAQEIAVLEKAFQVKYGEHLGGMERFCDKDVLQMWKAAQKGT